MNQPVLIVTIKNKRQLYKNETPASSIELIELEEVGYELVAAKGLYKIGNKAILIQPDYNVSNISLFESYIRPINPKTNLPDEKSSKLGKVDGQPRRIRAKKFTLSKEPNGDFVYSNGILLPYNEVYDYLESQDIQPMHKDISHLDLTNQLGITKYEEPEVFYTNKHGNNVSAGRKLPSGVYKTDETNINNLWNHLENHIKYPVKLIGTVKWDGSSISIGCKNGVGFICSRQLQKDIYVDKIIGKREKTLLDYLKFWKKPDLLIRERILNIEDNFVKYGKPYMDKLVEYCKMKNKDYIVRFELHGKNMKGSGNPNNPSSKHDVKLSAYSIDDYSNGIAERVTESQFCKMIEELEFERCEVVFDKQFESKEDLLNTCNSFFKSNMIEGIVVRTYDSVFSAKVMNLEYDSKK